jgi:ubiquinone/menaquinone biosynthesis C-methylase UbiE
VRAQIEWRERRPFLQMAERLVLGNAGCEAFEQGDVQAPEPAPLRHEPGLESRAAVDLQAIEKIAGVERLEGLQLRRRHGLEVLFGPGDLDRIDGAVRKIDPDAVALRLDPAPGRLVDQAPDLAEAPAQLAARVVRHVPKQLAKLTAPDRARRERQPGEQPPHLTRSRQRQHDAVSANRERPEHPQLERRTAAPSVGFHARFHAAHHGRLHGWPLCMPSMVPARTTPGRPLEWRYSMLATAATIPQSPPPAQADLAAVKTRQQGAWSSGDYAIVGTTLQIVGEELCEALDLRSGQKVLDVAAGNGNVALAAARRWCDVIASDYVPALLERARERAAAERLDMTFREADAEALPFADASFDVVVSTFGVMFTPDQDRAAAELVRVCRPGGKIGLANWTPEGFIGQLFKTIGRHVPPPPGARSPALWGTRARLAELFERHAASIDTTQRRFVFRYRSPEHWLEIFRTYYGPLLKTFGALEPPAQAALQDDLLNLIRQFNRSGDGSMVVPSEYLEAVITRS